MKLLCFGTVAIAFHPLSLFEKILKLFQLLLNSSENEYCFTVVIQHTL